MRKEWECVASTDGLTLVFSPYGDEEEIAYVHRDIEGNDWILESELLHADGEYLCDVNTSDDEVKSIVESMVEEYYQGEINYYSELLRFFKED